MPKLTQDQLAERWHMSLRTLEQWRWLGKRARMRPPSALDTRSLRKRSKPHVGGSMKGGKAEHV